MKGLHIFVIDRAPVIFLSSLKSLLSLTENNIYYIRKKHGEALVKHGGGRRLTPEETRQVGETENVEIEGCRTSWVVTVSGLSEIGSTLLDLYIAEEGYDKFSSVISEMRKYSKKVFHRIVTNLNPITVEEATHRMSTPVSNDIVAKTRRSVKFSRALEEARNKGREMVRKQKQAEKTKNRITPGRPLLNYSLFTDNQTLFSELGYGESDAILLALRATCTDAEFEKIQPLIERSPASGGKDRFFRYTDMYFHQVKGWNYKSIEEIAKKRGVKVAAIREVLLEEGIIEKAKFKQKGWPAYRINSSYETTSEEKNPKSDPFAFYNRFVTKDLRLVNYIVYNMSIVTPLLDEKLGK